MSNFPDKLKDLTQIPNRLRVTHVPQIPGKSFHIPVENEVEAYKIICAISIQHLWLYQYNYIPDYANILSVEMYNPEEGEWEEYYNENHYAEWEELRNWLEKKLALGMDLKKLNHITL